jgi:hypothetical protein
MKYIFISLIGITIWAHYANVSHIHQRALGTLTLVAGIALLVKKAGELG